jgi:hypothetical protein
MSGLRGHDPDAPNTRHRTLIEEYEKHLPEVWERRAEIFANAGTPKCDEIAAACIAAGIYYREHPLWTEDDLIRYLREAG